jgi:lysozyme
LISFGQLKERLSIDEGRRLMPYIDTVGKTTVGVGHNLTDKGISDAVCDRLLQEDVEECVTAASSYPWFGSLDDARQGVVLCMIFNLGPEGFAKFKNTQALIAAHSYSEAADAMLVSKWASQVGIRARIYSQIMRTGVWQP